MPTAKELVVVGEYEVAAPELSKGSCGLRIAQVSDMHFSRWNRVYECAQRLLLSLEYDVLCVTGDFVDYRFLWKRSLTLAERFLKPIVDRKPVYAVLGNHDDPEIAARMSLPVRWLHNEGVVVRVGVGVGDGGDAVYLAGVDQNVHGADDLEAALSGSDGRLLTVLMAHYPSTVYRLPDYRVDLVLSGHTHGGQIRIPFLGCAWCNDALPRGMARGLHRVGRTWLHVSPGLGTSLPIRARFLCPPEISLLKLVPAPVSSTEGSCEGGVETRPASLPV